MRPPIWKGRPLSPTLAPLRGAREKERLRLARALIAAVVWVWPGGAFARAPAADGSAAAARAFDDGMSAIAARPPDHAKARAAFERAIAAGGDVATTSQAHFRVGLLDEDAGAFARALEHYRACVDGAPASAATRVARTRIKWLEQHAEGNFVPLVALERVRRDPARLQDPAAIDRLGAEAQAFPPGLVRSTARMMVAEAWLKRPDRHEAALGVLREIVGDSASGRRDARLAEHHLVTVLLADGRLDAAQGEVQAHPGDTTLVAQVDGQLHRRRVRRAAYAAVALVAAIAFALVIRMRARQRRSPATRQPAAGPDGEPGGDGQQPQPSVH